MKSDDPHGSQPVLRAGLPLGESSLVMIVVHGRGGSPEEVLSLGEAVGDARFTYLAPQAAGHTWYPNSFLAPLEQNEPYLSSALGKVQSTVQLATEAAIPPDRIVICGFSQGACLATEFVARYPLRYAGLIAFTGGLIGSVDADLVHSGDLGGMPVLFSSGDPDPHVPWQRVQQSADVLRQMGAVVSERRYPGRRHMVIPEEVELARELVQGLVLNVA